MWSYDPGFEYCEGCSQKSSPTLHTKCSTRIFGCKPFCTGRCSLQGYCEATTCLSSYGVNGSCCAVFAELQPVLYNSGSVCLSQKVLVGYYCNKASIPGWEQCSASSIQKGVDTPQGHSWRSTGFCSIVLSTFYVGTIINFTANKWGYTWRFVFYVASLRTATYHKAICTVCQMPNALVVLLYLYNFL